MRKTLRQLRKIEGHASFVRPKYPFTCDQDLEALEAKLTEIRDLLENFAGLPKSPEYCKISTKLQHATNRLGRCVPTTDEHRSKISKLLVALTSMSASLRSKAKQLARSSTLNASILDATNATNPGAESDSSSDGSGIAEARAVSPVSVKQKPVPVMHWKLKYSGDNSALSLNAFLERVEELITARNVTKDQVFRSAIDLFADRALIWYRANRKSISDWDELVIALREEFQPPDYDEQLFDEIRKRTQGPNESISMYVSTMTNLFARLTIKIPDCNRVKIMSKNLAPFYQSQLGLAEIKTVDELLAMGRKLELRRFFVDKYVPPPRRNQTLEPDLAYVASSSASSVSSAADNNERKCWNCDREGHFAAQCRQPRRKHCYRCGRPNVITRNCPQCSLNSR